jgi:methionine sulfoxide reductase heme-binding subunit
LQAQRLVFYSEGVLAKLALQMTESSAMPPPVDGRQRPLWNDPYVLWLVLAVPAMLMVVKGLFIGGKFPYLYWTGIIACWLIILTMSITPLSQAMGPLPWLKARRRYFGVASFAYVCLHLASWLANASVGQFLRSFIRPEVITGWIAFAIMVPLALTSNDASVRRMGPGWKSLQRWIYPAATLALVHWFTTTDFKPEVLVSVPLMLLSVHRLTRYRGRGGQRKR